MKRATVRCLRAGTEESYSRDYTAGTVMPESEGIRSASARLGRWAPLAHALGESAADYEYLSDPQAIKAAVLLLLYEKDGEPHIVLTKRTNHVAAHKGEISLPGGAYEADRDSSLLHTALREATEEVGIVVEHLQILGRLPSVFTQVSNYLIAPYVALSFEPPEFSPDPIEVAEVLEVPLAVLRDPAALREEDWELEGDIRHIVFYAHGAYKIWGATARILNEFLTVLERIDE